MKLKTQKNDTFLKKYLDEKKAILEKELLRLSGSAEIYPSTLYQSMHYSLFAGGKRIRPILVLASAEAVHGLSSAVISVAAAIEMIHTYSLIHDDLPAMDNDDMRRGKPTNHKVFGEATAILAGDALLTTAFTILSDYRLADNIPADKLLQIVHETGLCSGPSGMVGGQQIDMESVGKDLTIDDIDQLHGKKTGALIRLSVRAGAIASGASDRQLESLTVYASNIGLAFQIADDILDIEGTPEETGKSAGKDIIQKKNTYPANLGVERSRIIEKRLIDEAISALEEFDDNADPLRMIAEYIVERRN